MRMIGAREMVVGALFVVLAGCKSGGTAGSSWWNANPFKSAASTPTNPSNPYPPKPSQLYANSATSSPSSGISAGGSPGSTGSTPSAAPSRGLASSVSGGTRPGSTSATSPSLGTASTGTRSSGSMASTGSGVASYPGTRASYTAPGSSSTRPGSLESAGTSSGRRPMGTSTATDAFGPQRGLYTAPASSGGAGSNFTAGPNASSAFGRSEPALGAEGPLRSSGQAAPGFGTPSGGYGHSGVKDPFVSPSARPDTRSAAGAQGFYPITPGPSAQSERAGGTARGWPSTGSTGPAAPAGGWNYPSSAGAGSHEGTNRSVGPDRPYSGSASGPGSDSMYGPPRSDSRPGPAPYSNAGSEYRPGSTGYRPPASDYRPGQTGYAPPSAGSGYLSPRSGSAYGTAPAGSTEPYRYPSTSSSNLTPEDAPYRPGSVTEYQPRAAAPGTSGPPASVSNPWVSPNPYGHSAPGGNFSTGPAGTLR